jgi:hypothetical protein
MGEEDHGGAPGAVTVRAGRAAAVDGGCPRCGLLAARAEGPANVIVDLRGTMSLDRRALDIIGYVSDCYRAGRRRLGIVAAGPVRAMIEATAPAGSLDIAASAGELAALWTAAP